MLTAHTTVTVEGTVERGPFEDVARSYFETLWQGMINSAPVPQDVGSTVEFKYLPLDTPVAEVEISAVRHPIVSATSTLAVSAPFNEDEAGPSTVVLAAQVAHHNQADIEAAVARIAGTLPEFVTVDMVVRAHTARNRRKDEDWPLAPPKLDVDHPLAAGTEPIKVPTNSVVGDIAAPAKTAGERLSALLASHPEALLHVSVPILTPEGLAWLDSHTQDMTVSVLTEWWDENAFRHAPDDHRIRAMNFLTRTGAFVHVRRKEQPWARSRRLPTPRAFILEGYVGATITALSGPTVLNGHWLDSEDDTLAPLDAEDVRRIRYACGRMRRRARLVNEQIREAVS